MTDPAATGQGPEGDFERFFRFSRDLLCIAGYDGRFKGLNPAWEQLLGWPLEELLRVPYLDFVHPEDAARLPTLLKGGALEASFRVTWPDGSEHAIFARGRLTADSTGRLDHGVGICQLRDDGGHSGSYAFSG